MAYSFANGSGIDSMQDFYYIDVYTYIVLHTVKGEIFARLLFLLYLRLY